MTEDNQTPDRSTSKRTLACPPGEGPGLLWHNLTDFYCNFFDLIEVAAVMVDTTGNVRMFNRKAEKLTGFSRAEAIGQDCFSLLLPGHRRADARARLMRYLKDEQVPAALSMDIQARDGTGIPMSWNVNVVRDDDGKVFGLVGLGYPSREVGANGGINYASDNMFSHIELMTHDLLNHSQVAMGYLELAMERAGGDTDLQCMLNRACIALKKCGDLAIGVHKLSGSPDVGYARLAGTQKDNQS